MATPVEIVEEQIRKLEGEILGLETEQRLAKSDALKIAFGAQITAKQETLTVEKQRLLHLEQQGEIHLTFPLFFPNLLDVIRCPISFDSLVFFNFQFFMGTGPHPHESYRMT